MNEATEVNEGAADAADHAADAEAIRIEGVTKRFGEVAAVSEMDLVIFKGEFFSMLGPVRLRQDDDPADGRRLRAADRGRDLSRR